MGQRFRPRATIGELQDELLETIETGLPVDHGKIRHVHEMLNELRTLFGREPEPDRVEVEEEITGMIRGEITQVITERGDGEQRTED